MARPLGKYQYQAVVEERPRRRRDEPEDAPPERDDDDDDKDAGKPAAVPTSAQRVSPPKGR